MNSASSASTSSATPSTLSSAQTSNTLAALYADAAAQGPRSRPAGAETGAGAGASTGGIATTEPTAGRYEYMRLGYMAVGPDFGRLLYSLARTTKAKTVVEFGTSFGISTIFLAAAMRDNGNGGKVITTEFHPEKAEKAKQNLTAAGLVDWVEFRVGDALETLSPSPTAIDMIFLDGAKELYLPVLQILEPQLKSGGIIASDNTDHEGMANFLEYIRTPANGYTSSAILTGGERGKAHEITVRN